MSCESPAVRVPAKDVEPELDAERCRDFCGWHLDTPVTLASCQNVVCLSVCLSGKAKVSLRLYGNESSLMFFSLHVKICADVVIHHTCASDTVEDRLSTRGSYFTATREEFPSVPFPSADFNDDECTSGGGNIENYRDIYQL